MFTHEIIEDFALLLECDRAYQITQGRSGAKSPHSEPIEAAALWFACLLTILERVW